MGTKYGIAYSDGHERRVLGTNNATMLPAVRALAETPDGNIWAGADDGTLYHCEPEKLTPFRPEDALAEQPIYSLLADTDGTLWAGTFRGGLLRFRQGGFFVSRPSTVCRWMSSARFWMTAMAGCGWARIRAFIAWQSPR